MNKLKGVTFRFDDELFETNRRFVAPALQFESSLMSMELPTILSTEVRFDDVTPDIKWVLDTSYQGSIDDMIEETTKKSQDIYNRLIQDARDELNLIDQTRKERLRQLEERKRIQEEIRKKREAEILKKREEEANKIAASADKANDTATAPSQNVSTTPFIPQNVQTNKFLEYLSEFKPLRQEYQAFVNTTAPDVKSIRIAIIKQITACVNTVAGTIKQVEQTHSIINSLLSKYTDHRIQIFIIFRIIEGILNCCEPGCQMFINPKSVWPFAHLIRGLCMIEPKAISIYSVLIAKRSIYVIPKMYVSNDQEALKKLHKFNTNETNYCKYTQAIVRLHLAFLTVTNNHNSIWTWFAGFTNSCWSNVFKTPLPAVLISALETSAFIALKIYKQQFVKLLRSCEDLLERNLQLESDHSPTALMYNGQLRHFFTEFSKTQTLAEPVGFNMKHQEEELRRDV